VQVDYAGRDKVGLRRRRKLGIALGAAILFACFLICGNFGPIIDYLCRRDSPIAELDAGDNRIIAISAASCWEGIGRPLYYEVRDNGMVVISKTLFCVDMGEEHSYSLIYAENQSIIGVLEITTSSPNLRAIVDFRTRTSWPRSEFYEGWRIRIQKLRQENPEVEISLS
jgi:hypothetical protein